MLRSWMLLCCLLLSAVQQPSIVSAADDGRPCELEAAINQLVNPNPVYQLHASALRNQLRNLLRERQLGMSAADDVASNDYDYLDEDKRSVAALAAQGLLNPKRSLATLAKNGQLPSSPVPQEDEPTEPNEEKRYVGALARGGGVFTSYGKRNIGSLARDYQLPQNGKRNLATLARLGLLTKGDQADKRNMAAVARYNSNGRLATMAPTEKRNLGALKGSPVHGGVQQKRDEEEVYLPASLFSNNMDYVDMVPNYWMYPSYADMDWGEFARAQKRFLDTSKDPELFGIENALPSTDMDYVPEEELPPDDYEYNAAPPYPPPQKRHIGAVYRSGFLPSYRALRSTTGTYGGGGNVGVGGGRFSRSGRARQFVEYYPPRERLRQPIAAVCKRCFLPYRPAMHHWGAAAAIRGRLPISSRYAASTITTIVDDDANSNSILTNSLPTTSGRRPIAYASTNSGGYGAARLRTSAPAQRQHNHYQLNHHWGTPPRITALHRRSFRRPDGTNMNSMENY